RAPTASASSRIAPSPPPPPPFARRPLPGSCQAPAAESRGSVAPRSGRVGSPLSSRPAKERFRISQKYRELRVSLIGSQNIIIPALRAFRKTEYDAQGSLGKGGAGAPPWGGLGGAPQYFP